MMILDLHDIYCRDGNGGFFVDEDKARKVFYTNTCLNARNRLCRVEFAQNEDDDAGKLTLVKEKDEVLSKFCWQDI